MHDITNYRPISILSVFSKIFERIVHNRMMNFIDKYNILDTAQHGFRQGRSTETAALFFTEFVYDCLDKNLFVARLFFDLSRAFDSLSFEFLIDKFYNLGFRGVFLSWLKSYLCGRTISVEVENSFSQEEHMKLGIPQGSVLGPLLFLFINDLPSHLKKMFYLSSNLASFELLKITFRLVLFADDISVVITAKTFTELQNMSTITAVFCDWCHPNSVIINVNKTEIVHFKNSNNVWGELNLEQLGNVIESKQFAKFLGIHLDQYLVWSFHVNSVCKKLNSSFYAISIIKNSLPLHSLINVYYSLVYSHISYGIMLWGNSSDVGRVFIAQKRILQLIFNISPRTSCRSLFKDYNILTVASLFILRCLVYAKENENSFTKLKHFHSYYTRNDKLMSIPKHRTTKFESSPLYKCKKLFNHLPRKIQCLSLKEFKKQVLFR